MNKRRRFSQAEQQQLKNLHAEGLGLKAISRHMKRSASTINKWSKKLGLSYDRSGVEHAVKAHRADAAKLRTELCLRLLQESNEFLDSLHKPQLVYSFANNGSYNERLLDKPSPADARNIMTSVGIALQRSIELARIDQQSQTPVTVIDEYLKTLGIN